MSVLRSVISDPVGGRRGSWKEVTKGKSVLIISTFIQRAFEIRLAYSLGPVSRTLRVHPVCSAEDPIFALCKKGDIAGLRTAFDQRKLSPFLLDEQGNSLLHVRAIVVYLVYRG